MFLLLFHGRRAVVFFRRRRLVCEKQLDLLELFRPVVLGGRVLQEGGQLGRQLRRQPRLGVAVVDGGGGGHHCRGHCRCCGVRGLALAASCLCLSEDARLLLLLLQQLLDLGVK